MRRESRRRFMTTSWPTRLRDWLQRRIMSCTRIDWMRSAKYKRPYSWVSGRRPNKPRWLSSRMTRRNVTWFSKQNKRIEWRIRSLNSRSTWPKSRLNKRRIEECTMWRSRMKRRSTMRTIRGSRKRTKSCRWRHWKWSLLRSYRIHKLFRRMPTKSLRGLWRSQVLWWLATRLALRGNQIREEVQLLSNDDDLTYLSILLHLLNSL